MMDKRRRTWESLEDPKYRRGWADEHVGVGLAFQIRALRESRGWTQSELGERTGKAQETLSQLENPNYGRYTLSTLKKIAAAFDVGLLVRFVPFSELVDWNMNITFTRLAPPSYGEEAAVTGQTGARKRTDPTATSDYIVADSAAESFSSEGVIIDMAAYRRLTESASSPSEALLRVSGDSGTASAVIKVAR